jgi:non-specific serine/threonine protein kinase
MTQLELASVLGVTRNTVARWERGELAMARPEMIDAALKGMSPPRGSRKSADASVRPSTGELPRQVTSFVGREREISRLRGSIESSQLTTLTGTGGVGKTRLALEVVGEIDRTSIGEVALVELASLADPSLVSHSVAAALGVGHHTQQDWSEYLANVLRERRILIVLDNCEHVVMGCAELADKLLRRCPELRILATSREPLRVAGETVWRVPSLSVPDERDRQSPEQIANSESVRLFADRACAMLPTFTVTDTNATAVARLCRRLDGIPLALELAAARLPVLSVEQIANRLDDALGLLNSGSRVGPARQQTLRGTLEWSYGLLPECEQLLLRRLSVFASGWTLESAEGVCAGDGIKRHDLLDLLAQLVDKSLVVSEFAGEGAVRYRLLETVRQFTMGRLSTSGELPELREEHLRWFLQTAERAEAQPGQYYTWFPWFYREIDNLRSALDWAVESRNAIAGLRLCDGLRRFWVFGMGIYASEGLARLKTVMMLPDATHDTATYALGLIEESALIRICGGDLEVARSLGERGLALTRTLGQPKALHLALIVVGAAALVQGDEPAAVGMLQESLELAIRMGESWRWERAKSLSMLGFASITAKRFARARPLLEESIVALRAEGDQLTLAETLGYLVETALHAGQISDARTYAMESLKLAAALGSVPNIARALDALVRVAAAERSFEHALRLYGALSSVYRRAGTIMWRISGKGTHLAVAEAQLHLGEVRAAQVRAQGAAMSMSEAVTLGLSGLGTSEAVSKGDANHRGPQLTDREIEVLGLLASGRSNREIASNLVLSTRTVERHIENLYAKIGVNARAGAIAYALRGDIGPPDQRPTG